jgi:uncharacterized protein
MRIAVVSDTHGHIGYTTAAVRAIRQEHVGVVLHCGDIGSAAIVPQFSEWPTHFVFGNVDDDDGPLSAEISAAGQTCHQRFGTLILDGVKIAFLHSDDWVLFDETVETGAYDLVCYGHTHVAEQHRVGKTLVLNPGALYRATPHTFAVVELPGLDVRHVTVGT